VILFRAFMLLERRRRVRHKIPYKCVSEAVDVTYLGIILSVNPLNTELNPICQ